MNVFLMHRDRDFDTDSAAPCNEETLMQDLELETLLGSMAHGDRFLYDVCRKALLTSLTDTGSISYRQRILADCIGNPEATRELYDLAVEGVEARRKSAYYGAFSRYPSGILSGSVGLLQAFTELLRRLRQFAEKHGGSFQSEGFSMLFSMLIEELSDDYLEQVNRQLAGLRLRAGTLISARLGESTKGTDYVLRRPRKPKGWVKRLAGKIPTGLTYRVADRDEAGARTVSEIKDMAINPVANALGQSADHVVGFFKMLCTELAFYVGCLNLYDQLSQDDSPVCFPEPLEQPCRAHDFVGLYDPCLALTLGSGVVGSDVNVGESPLVIVTGANQGGKSTFLRSVGVAQLMMQSGMFVAATEFRANIGSSVFTHFRRKEDATMESGKFDEELVRMSEIVDHIRPHALVLFNESFAATNEREGSEIARQVVTALVDTHVKVFFVTHMYEFARWFYDRLSDSTYFLRAGRQSDGTRTYRIAEGEPLRTSYGEDLYRRIFGERCEEHSPGRT